jgi:hypothetical protein
MHRNGRRVSPARSSLKVGICSHIASSFSRQLYLSGRNLLLKLSSGKLLCVPRSCTTIIPYAWLLLGYGLMEDKRMRNIVTSNRDREHFEKRKWPIQRSIAAAGQLKGWWPANGTKVGTARESLRGRNGSVYSDMCVSSGVREEVYPR